MADIDQQQTAVCLANILRAQECVYRVQQAVALTCEDLRQIDRLNLTAEVEGGAAVRSLALASYHLSRLVMVYRDRGDE